MSTYVKVCGLRRAAEARAAVAAGANAVGVVFSARSSRNVTIDEARAVVAAVRDVVDTVVVSNDRDATEAARIAAEIGASVVQLHGAYSSDDIARAQAIIGRVWRATTIGELGADGVGSYGEEALLLDSPVPGSGVPWDLSALGGFDLTGRWLLAGGLTPDNVAAAIAAVRPWGVDVSSGVESAPGVKDLDKIAAFVAAVQGADECAD